MRHIPSGLFKSDASFASSLLGAIPTEAVSPVCLGNPPANFRADHLGAPMQLPARGHIEKRLIQRQPFHQRRECMKNREYLCDISW